MLSAITPESLSVMARNAHLQYLGADVALCIPLQQFFFSQLTIRFKTVVLVELA
jgi:hypothetical protein